MKFTLHCDNHSYEEDTENILIEEEKPYYSSIAEQTRQVINKVISCKVCGRRKTIRREEREIDDSGEAYRKWKNRTGCTLCDRNFEEPSEQRINPDEHVCCTIEKYRMRK